YDYTLEERVKICRRRQLKHLEGFVHRVELLHARRAVPFAGNFALPHADQLWMNEKDQNNINTPDEAIALLAERLPSVEGLQMNPGDVWSLETGLRRHQPPPDFQRRFEDIQAMSKQVQARLRALDAAEPEARPGLRQDFARY